MGCISDIHYNGNTTNGSYGSLWTCQCRKGLHKMWIGFGALRSGNENTAIYNAIFQARQCVGGTTITVNRNGYFTISYVGYTYSLSYLNDKSAIIWTGADAVGNFTQFSALVFDLYTNTGLQWLQCNSKQNHSTRNSNGYARASQGRNSGIWTTVSPLQTNRSALGVAVLNQSLYAIGGYYDGDSTSTLATTEIYNLTQNQWIPMTPIMSVPRAELAVGIIGTSLYAVGGINSSLDSLSLVEKYTIESNKWTTVTPMNQIRRGLGVATLNNLMYAIGGNGGGEILKSAEVYDPIQNTWSPITDMNKPRNGLAVGVLGNLIYAIGGTDGTLSILNTCEVYDPSSTIWTLLSPMNTARANLTVSVLGGILYAIGGTNRVDTFRTVEAYNPVLDKWTEIIPINNPYADMSGSGVIGSRIYVVGGRIYGGSITTNSVEYYTT